MYHNINHRRTFRLPHEQSSKARLQWALARINVRVLCEEIYRLHGRGGYYFSPIRHDGLNPAFDIRADGEVGIDHATSEGFNALTLIARVENLTPAEARSRLIFYAEQNGGLFATPLQISRLAGQPRQDHSWQQLPEAKLQPALHAGEVSHYQNFAKLRGLHLAALMIAHGLRLFFFLERYPRVLGLCTITDNARYARQDRCTLGGYVPLKGGSSTKSRTIGAASWPVGSANIGHKPVVLLVEGLPDLLAAVQVIIEENRLHDTAPVAMLGAGQHINTHALRHFAGKHVRIFPDQDEAGRKGAVTWAEQLRGVAAKIDRFSFEDHPILTQKPIKDLNDFVTAGGIHACKHMIPKSGGKK